MKKVIRIAEILLFILFLILLIFLKDKLSLFVTIPLILLIYFVIDKLKIKNYALFIFVIALITRIISIIYLKVEIVDDFKTMLDASKMLINGNLSFANTFYFKTFSYQLGHVLYQASLLKIYNKVIVLKIVNSLITSIIVLLIYLISRKIFKEKTARIISLSYIFYLYPVYLNSVLTNQHIPALIVLIIIYLILYKNDTTKKYILIAVLLSISNILRTESIVLILSIIIYNITRINKKSYKNLLKNTIIMIIIYFTINIVISNIIYISPIHLKLENNAPTWKFYCGLNYQKNGMYNIEDQERYFSSNNTSKLLINRVKETNLKLPILFLKKEVILWTQTNYDLRITNRINNKVYSFVKYLNQGYLNTLIILSVISLFPYRKERNNKLLFIKIILGLYACIYAFIEVSPRYSYVLHILLFMCIGVAIDGLINNRKLKEKNNEKETKYI